MLAEKGRGGPDDGLADGVGKLLPGQAFSQPGGDDLLGYLVSGHAPIIGDTDVTREPVRT
jgi:hypothetical protein